MVPGVGGGQEDGGRQGVMALVLEITNHPQEAWWKNAYGYYIKQYDGDGNPLPPEKGYIIWSDVSNEANISAQIILDLGGNITEKDIGFFIIPNGGGYNTPCMPGTDNGSGLLNPEFGNMTEVIFKIGSDGKPQAFLANEDGSAGEPLQGLQRNLVLDTDKDETIPDKYGHQQCMIEGEIEGHDGNQHWEDMLYDKTSGYFDHNDVNITVNWTTKNVVYNTNENEILAGSDGRDLFVWDSNTLGGMDTIENFDCAMDKLLFYGLFDGNTNALTALLDSGFWTGDTFTATDGGTTLNLSITGDTATLELTAGKTTQTIAIEGGVQPFIDNQGDDTATATLLQNIISVSG